MRKRTLGKGLGELLGSDELPQGRSVLDVPVGRLSPNPRQPRAAVDGDRLEELTISIEAHGVLQPIIARMVEQDYEIVAGERRWRAAQRAGLESVPCVVVNASDEESLQYALVENLQREDLNAVEAARGYRRLIDDFDLTQEQVAQYIGKSRSAVANTLRLLDLPAPVLEAIQTGHITEGHGRALLGLAGDEQKLLEVWQAVQEQSMTVRAAESMVREALAPAAPPAPDPPSPRQAMDPNLKEAQEQIQAALATKVTIRTNSRGGGRIEVSYSDGEEFERLFDLLASLD